MEHMLPDSKPFGIFLTFSMFIKNKRNLESIFFPVDKLNTKLLFFFLNSDSPSQKSWNQMLNHLAFISSFLAQIQSPPHNPLIFLYSFFSF